MPDDQPITNAELRAALDAAVETIAGKISAFRTEVNVRCDTLERRLERTENSTNALLLRTAGISRSLTFAERADKKAG